MSHTPLISICIPAYNAVRYLPEALDSIRSQTFQDWELIVVEDGSNDGTMQLVQGFADSASNPVHYLRHEANKGLPATRNTAINVAKGTWIAILDADDIWAPNHLELLAGSIPDRPALLHSISLIFDEDPQKVVQKREPPENMPADDAIYAGEYIIQPSSVMLHRDLLKAVGPFDESIEGGYSEDLDYWLRAVSLGYPIICNQAETCFYRKHPAALTSKGAKSTLGSARIRLKHIYAPVLNQEKRNQIAANYLAAAGRMHLRSEPLAALELYKESVKLVPTRLDRVLLLMLSWIFSKA